MRNVLFDSGIWISTYGSCSTDPSRQATRDVVKYILDHPAVFRVWYSERNRYELAGDPRLVLELDKHPMLPYQTLDETWGEVDGSWGNIDTVWEDTATVELGAELRTALPDKKRKPNNHDRGIFGDAVTGGCYAILHENPSDFNRLVAEAQKSSILLIDLVHTTAGDAIAMLDGL